METSAPVPPDQERVIWTTHPSQITNFGIYVICLAVWLAVIPAFILLRNHNPPPYLLICLGAIMAIAFFVFLARWVRTRCRVYQVTSERIKVTDGVLNRRTEELELYRVRDYKVTEPFWLRLFGLGHIVISSMDVSTPSLVLQAVRDPNGRREELRKYVEACRDKKRVRVTEFES